MNYFRHATDVAAYAYQADLHCPACIREMFAWATAPVISTAEATLDAAARARGIDRYNADTNDFPAVAFVSDLNEESLDHCGSCADCLAHDLSDHPTERTPGDDADQLP